MVGLVEFFTVYLNLYPNVNTFDKNNRYLKELIKITYDPFINPF